jgi:hypothetical protein
MKTKIWTGEKLLSNITYAIQELKPTEVISFSLSSVMVATEVRHYAILIYK